MSSADEIVQDIPFVKLGGKDFKIKYTLSSLHFLTKRFGSIRAMRNVFSDAESLSGMSREAIEAIIAVIYAGVFPLNKNITEEGVADIVDVSELLVTFSVCMQVLNNHYIPGEAKTDDSDEGNGDNGDSADPTLAGRK